MSQPDCVAAPLPVGFSESEPGLRPKILVGWLMLERNDRCGGARAARRRTFAAKYRLETLAACDIAADGEEARLEQELATTRSVVDMKAKLRALGEAP